MIQTRSQIRRSIKYISTAILVLIIGSYAVWKGFDYISGPKINVFTPPNGYATTSEVIKIYGQIERVSDLKINGHTVLVDVDGNFSDFIALFPGINFTNLTAKDRFGRSVTEILEIVKQ